MPFAGQAARDARVRTAIVVTLGADCLDHRIQRCAVRIEVDGLRVAITPTGLLFRRCALGARDKFVARLAAFLGCCFYHTAIITDTSNGSKDSSSSKNSNYSLPPERLIFSLFVTISGGYAENGL